MARMYSRSKGQSGSKKPLKATVPTWVRYKPKEVELLIAKLYKEKNSPSRIGLILRDVYGIPSVKVLTKKSINQILKEKNLLAEIPEDIMSLMKKNIQIRKHLAVLHAFSCLNRPLGFCELHQLKQKHSF